MNNADQPISCRLCHNIIDAHASVKGDIAPRPNDFSVCLYCGTLSKFDEELNLIPLTPSELFTLNKENPETFDLLIKTRTVILQRLETTKPKP